MSTYRKPKWQWMPLFDGETTVLFGASPVLPRDDNAVIGVEIVNPEPGEAPTAILTLGQAKRLHRWLGARIGEMEGK